MLLEPQARSGPCDEVIATKSSYVLQRGQGVETNLKFGSASIERCSISNIAIAIS